MMMMNVDDRDVKSEEVKMFIGHKGTPFPHLQFMAQIVPPPRFVTMLRRRTKPLTRGGGKSKCTFSHTSNLILHL